MSMVRSVQFADQDLPFHPLDDLRKPEVGDRLVFKNQSSLSDMPKQGTVYAVYDSLADDWGNDGENAWSMWDTNTEAGFKGRWYACCEEPDDPYQGHWAVASYEVKLVNPV